MVISELASYSAHAFDLSPPVANHGLSTDSAVEANS
jgi:hypothetical protein